MRDWSLIPAKKGANIPDPTLAPEQDRAANIHLVTGEKGVPVCAGISAANVADGCAL
jgi:hypothetical protein